MDGWIRIGTDLDTKKFDTQTKQLKNKISQIEVQEKTITEEINRYRTGLSLVNSEIDKVNKGLVVNEDSIKKINQLLKNTNFSKLGGNIDVEDLSQESLLQNLYLAQEKITDEIDKQGLKYDDLNLKTEKYKTQINSLKNQHENATTRMSKGFSKLTTSATKLAFGFFGVQSVISLLSKATSSYMATDEKATKQIEANWVGLGTILEPVINLIIKLMKKAVTGVLYFMSVLTGVDYIAKANANALKKQTKATKDLTKANDKFNASFDEMNIIQEPSNTSTDTSNQLIDKDSLFNIDDLGESAKNTIEKIAKALQPLYKNIKNIIDWALDHPDIIATILGGTALLSLLKNIIGNKSTGLLGLNGLLTGLATMGVISIVINVKSMIDTLKETREATDRVSDSIKKRGQIEKKNIENEKKAVDYAKKNTSETAKLNKQIDDNIDKYHKKNNVTIDTLNGYNQLQLITKNWTGELQNNVETLQTDIELEYGHLLAQKKLYDQGKLNEVQVAQYKENLRDFNNTLNGTSEEAKNTRDWFNYFGDSTERLAELQSFAKNETKKMGISLDSLGGIIDIATRSSADFSTALFNIPKNNKINIDTNINKAKSLVDNFRDGLLNLTKKVFKIDINFKTSFSGNLSNQILDLFNNFNSQFSKTNKMATGGIHIVNNPGKGVPIGYNTIAGEGGVSGSREGVIPLTDARAMSQLGVEIGRNINLKATIPIYVGNRQIAREIRNIDAQDEFTFNR